MSDTSTVLCFSEDPDKLDRLVAPLEWSYPDVRVLHTDTASSAIDHLEDGGIDTLVLDARTAAATPHIVRAAREQYPRLSVLLLTDYETKEEGGVAISDVVEFVDTVEGADETFSGWVANAVVSEGKGGPVDRPNGDRYEEMVREVRQRLVDATAPKDFEKAVCDALTVSEGYLFTWIGEYDRGEQQVVPWVTGGTVDDWPRSTSFAVGTGTESIVDRALRSHELQVANGFGRDDGAVPWAKTAVENGGMATAVAPLIDKDDELLGVMGVYTDTPTGFDDLERRAIRNVADATAHVLGTMALRGEAKQQERVLQRYERLVETVGDGMYALDSDGHFMTINNGLVEMTGYSREGLLGEHVSLVIDGLIDEENDGTSNATPSDEAVLDELVSDRPLEPETMEVRLRRKDGKRIPCEAKVGGLWEDDEYRGSVGVLRDITDRKRRERALRRQNERLDAFASIVSHDLRNPLGVAQGYVDVLAESENLEELEHVTASLDRMEAIIQDVLELARRGGNAAETEPVSLEDVVEDAWSNVETKGATLEVDRSTTIAADRSRLLRFLENLFRNAIEHGGEDVTLRVGRMDDQSSTDAPGDDSVGFYVADDGAGIPPSVRGQLFDSEFSTSETGLGIGLWVVKEVASAHDWTTNATESRSGGARFEFENVRQV